MFKDRGVSRFFEQPATCHVVDHILANLIALDSMLPLFEHLLTKQSSKVIMFKL